MRDDDGSEHVNTTEARAGSGVKDNLFALLVGIGLLVVLFAIIVLVAGL